MAKCMMCQSEVEDGSRFCPYCGHEMSVTTKPIEPVTESTATVDLAQNNPSMIPPVAIGAVAAPADLIPAHAYENTENKNRLLQVFGSKLWLIACIFFSVYCGLHVIELLISMAISKTFQPELMMIPLGLLLGAVWACFAAGKKKEISKAGFGCAKGGTICAIVFCSIAVVGIGIALIVLMALGTSIRNKLTFIDPSFAYIDFAMIMVSLLITLVSIILQLVLYCSAKALVYNATDSLLKPQTNISGAKSLAVCMILIGIYSLVNVIASFCVIGYFNFFTLLCQMIHATALFVFAKCFMRLSRKAA